MKYRIRDLRNNEELKRERDAEELVHQLPMMALVYHAGKGNGVGGKKEI